MVIDRPLKVATPPDAVTVAVPTSDPDDGVKATDRVASAPVVTRFPYWSWICTTGCDANATPATVDADGCAVNTNCDAAACVRVTEDVVLTWASGRPAVVKVRVYVPVTVPIARSVKVITPLEAVTVVVPVKGPDETDTVTVVELSLVTRAPLPSSNSRTGWVPSDPPTTPPTGDVTNARDWTV